jgi:hypothetical protein
VAASAGRGQSLLKSKGLIRTIADIVTKVETGAKSIVKSAVIIGQREEDSGLVTLNLNKHIESRMVKIPIESDGLPNPGAVTEASLEFMNKPNE